ncbi:hypothetical protein Cs7R123_62860 [Catellatospora sp. TT07R-123]|uniref:hypothetical protein n=1 Tax=Catellatospora sp. TT07R-123 TaxID=2733863 RepID=UPI001B2B93F7|nr:hypothetical protein [Catellatospora sp. TT07R-123]GHJ48944.1 hypothetical protein Cs7R123_62860 [Catellatospora sp. TT07R-123]
MAERMDSQPGIRDLASSGRLAEYFEQASETEQRRLRIDVRELVQQLVFTQLTRKLELRRGHRDCMVAVTRLRPECLDRHHDDMDAVVDDVLHSARTPIQNLEGWVSSRLTAVTIDAHRRRRGERGALQRPRLPRWLIEELGQDQRLMGVALDMLDWVGIETSAGLHDWPIEAWEGRRLAGSGHRAGPSVAEDIATVVAAMRKRPLWYAKYVERPMGRKALPMAVHDADGGDPVDPGWAAQEADLADDARRAELAELTVLLVGQRLARGEDVREVVVDVVATLFGSGTASEEMGRAPGLGSTDDEQVMRRLAEPETVDRIVALVLDLLG